MGRRMQTARRAAGVAAIAALVSVSAAAVPVHAREAGDEDLVNDLPAAVRDPREVAVEVTGKPARANEQVELPRRGSEMIQIGSAFGAPTVAMGLPETLGRAPARQATDVAVSFDSRDSSFEVTAESLEDGARALVTIRNGSAPTEYRYTFDVSSADVRLSLVPSGGVEIVDEHNEAIAYVEAPWAIDANGDRVATRFHVEGQTLVQTVEHRGAAYPVVADPAVQHDCGFVTCTIRFDRQRTHFIGFSGQSVLAISSTVCGLIPAAPVAVVCAAVVNTIGWAVSSHARNYYNNGNCYGIRYPRNFPLVSIPPPHSTQVMHGTYNCTGK